MKDFTHLHVHTEYSLLDGASRISELIDRACELGMKSIAITDHGSMFGVVDFYKEAKKKGIKPIIGSELYVAQRTLYDKDPDIDRFSYHLILLARNEEGYSNLIKLNSIAYVDGVYYKPRIDRDILKKYSGGLIALSACMSGELPRAIMSGNYEKAKNIALEYQEIFGKENYYIELQDHHIPEQKEVNNGLLKVARELDIPVVATNDVHYVRKEDNEVQDVLMCISTGAKVMDTDRMKMPTNEFYLKSRDEMEEIFRFVPDALENTNKIAERCNFDFDFDTYHLPEFTVPEGYTAYEYLKKLCYDGIKRNYGENATEEVKNRVDFELETIRSMGYVEYFLIVWDFIRFAKEQNIIVGPGRGSAAGSIVAYALSITSIDPIKYGLIFERFLNPERVSMPDIDIDFCYERREEVINYVKEKYGEDHVAQIITFGTLGAKNAIRDVARVMNVPIEKSKKIAEEIPDELKITIEKALVKNEKLRNMYESDYEVKKVIDMAKRVEGMMRNTSTHAAGVVISKNPVDTYVPLYSFKGALATQYPAPTLEELGLLKMDFLGIRTLTVIRNTLDLIEINREKMGYTEVIDFSKMQMEDKNVFKMIADGDTDGVFQMENEGMREALKRLAPESFEDIVADISLYRPGPMESIPKYIENKNNPDRITYVDEKLKPILDVTYGCFIYQEQVMQVVRDLGGYSFARSDQVRRAMSKKKMDVMEEERQYFIHGKYDEDGNIEIPGCIRNGVKEEAANKIYDDLIDFANYGFNKSHAVAYGVVAYQTAYLKYYYPVEFMASIMNSFIKKDITKVAGYMRVCDELGIEIKSPDINSSKHKFTVDGKAIIFGLESLKNVGAAQIHDIINERDLNGPYRDIEDFIRRTNDFGINKRTVESLIKSGSFDNMKYNRATMLQNYEKVMDAVKKEKKNNLAGQLSMFDMFDGMDEKVTQSFVEVEELDRDVILDYEREVAGICISGHPLETYEEDMKKYVTLDVKQINAALEYDVERQKIENQIKIFGGIVIRNKVITTKKNNQMMAYITVEDLFGTAEVVVFPNLFNKKSDIIAKNSKIYIKGRFEIHEGKPQISANDIIPMNTAEENKEFFNVENSSGNSYGYSYSNRYNSSMNESAHNSYNGNISMKPVQKKIRKVYIKIDSMKNQALINDILKTASGLKGEDVIIFAPEDENTGGKKKGYKVPNVKVIGCDILVDMLSKIVPRENIAIV